MDQLFFSVVKQSKYQSCVVSKDDGTKLQLQDIGRSTIGNQVEWQLSAGSMDSLVVKRGVCDKTTVFQTSNRKHLITMHPSLLQDKQSTISWMSKTYRAEQYQIFIDNSQQGSKGDTWVHLVIASALLVAKQEVKALQDAAHKAAEQVGQSQKRRQGQRFALGNGTVTFEI